MNYFKGPLVACLLLLCSPAIYANESAYLKVTELFDAAEVEATFVLIDQQGATRFVHNKARAEQRFSPASTFKIFNTLIALDVGIVTSAESSFTWDGMKRWLESWNQDHTLESAFRVSCVWCYQQLARKIGRDHYLRELRRVDFGSQNIGEAVDQFWLDGSLTISAFEQAAFLKKLVNNQLPYDNKHTEIVKSIMFERQYRTSRLYGKTGWAASNINVGWYIGFVESEDQTSIFALSMVLKDIEQAPRRKQLVVEALTMLGVLPPED